MDYYDNKFNIRNKLAKNTQKYHKITEVWQLPDFYTWSLVFQSISGELYGL